MSGLLSEPVVSGMPYIGISPDTVYGMIAEKTAGGVPPLNFKAYGDDLKNYRIYGNTVNGASVGDLITNYFDYESWKNSITRVTSQGSITFNNDGTFTLAANENGGVFTLPYEPGNVNTYRIAVEPDTEYTICFSSDSSNILGYCYAFENGQADATHRHIAYNARGKKITFTTLSDTTYLTVRFDVADANTSITYGEVMLVEGDIVPETFLPHGNNYVIPVTVTDGEVEVVIPDIILDSPLAKAGDTADYIDYRQQKRFNADGTSVDVTLPAIPTLSGANTLSVGTAVQPSRVEITGKVT